MSKRKAIDELIEVMARLRAPEGCPWDQEQSHMSIRLNAVEEVYELVDAIESDDDDEYLLQDYYLDEQMNNYYKQPLHRLQIQIFMNHIVSTTNTYLRMNERRTYGGEQDDL